MKSAVLSYFPDRLRASPRPLALGVLLSLLFVPVQAAEHCTAVLSPALLDFGSATRGALLEHSTGSASASFGSRRTSLQVQCAEAMPMTLMLEAPAANARLYRFSEGTLQVRILGAQLDGLTVDWVRKGEEGTPNPDTLRPDDRMMPWRNGTVAAGRRLVLELELEARVSQEATKVRDVTRFETRGSFVVN
ncbi:hypothetical protein ACXPVS_04575 [Pseudomonas sp. Ma2-10]